MADERILDLKDTIASLCKSLGEKEQHVTEIKILLGSTEKVLLLEVYSEVHVYMYIICNKISFVLFLTCWQFSISLIYLKLKPVYYVQLYKLCSYIAGLISFACYINRSQGVKGAFAPPPPPPPPAPFFPERQEFYLYLNDLPTENGASESCMFQHISCIKASFMYGACMDDAWCASTMHVTCIVKREKEREGE